MKRKFKLFATVASLCLCLALMAFGVYAASTVSYTASGSVSYVVTDVKADFTLTVNKGSTKGKVRTADMTADNAKNGVTFAATSVAGSVKKSYDDNGITNPGGEDPRLTDSIGELDFATADIYQIVIKVENKSDSGKISVKCEISTDHGAGANWEIIPAEATYGTDKELAVQSGSVEYTYYVYLLNPALSIDSAAFALKVTATNVAD